MKKVYLSAKKLLSKNGYTEKIIARKHSFKSSSANLELGVEQTKFIEKVCSGIGPEWKKRGKIQDLFDCNFNIVKFYLEPTQLRFNY